MDLLVIPLGSSNLDVEPIYLQAQNGPIPELKRVVLSTGNRVVMEASLEEALAKLFPPVGLPAAPQPSTQPSPQAPAGPPQEQPAPAQAAMAAVVSAAQSHYQNAQAALRAGDWARYGDELKAMEADLRRLGELTVGTSP